MSKSAAIIYKRLLQDGTLDTRSFEKADYDQVVNFVKKSFPKATSLQRDVEQALKRTFVLGNVEKKNKTFKMRLPNKSSSQPDSRKQKKRRQKLVPRTLSYNHFSELNKSWKNYVSDVLRDTYAVEDQQQKLNRIDLHGALLTVVEANCSDYLGIEGIVVKETRNTFVIVTSANITKTIPKPENVFDVELHKPFGNMRIAGNSFTTRPAERASKKVKSFIEFVGAKLYRSRLRYS